MALVADWSSDELDGSPARNRRSARLNSIEDFVAQSLESAEGANHHPIVVDKPGLVEMQHINALGFLFADAPAEVENLTTPRRLIRFDEREVLEDLIENCEHTAFENHQISSRLEFHLARGVDHNGARRVVEVAAIFGLLELDRAAHVEVAAPRDTRVDPVPAGDDEVALLAHGRGACRLIES